MKFFQISRPILIAHELCIELLTNFRREEARSFTYRIAIKAADYEKALNADVWPHRVGVRLFRNKRNFMNPGSWSSQSGQTGGNVLTSREEYQNLMSARSTNSLVNINQPSRSESLAVQNRFVTPGFATEVLN